MQRSQEIYLTSVRFRDLILAQAQGRFCVVRRKPDYNECGQRRLTASIISSQFRSSLALSPSGRLDRSSALNKQKSGKTYRFSAYLRRSHSVLFEGAGE